MRIQHNIAAMNAYRNYNNNTSSLSKNLEKLSSGYKINRAGDDAAGLAISEKMRAQITGLNAAQKNVKDGVSLVKTAEGAMQEIQDMLNRMDYLATQSANGTYDNEVDRANLQKEVEALKTEINRIADSANFNGIKLLDGSLDSSEASTQTITNNTEAVTTTATADLLPAKGNELSVNTVLHKEASTGTEGTTFSVDLHNTVFSNGDEKTMTLTVGDKSWTLEGNGNGELKGEDLVNALVDKINEEADDKGNVALFNGQNFTISAGKDGDNRITFQQVSAPSSDTQEVDGDMQVKIEGDIGSGVASAGVPATKAKYTIDLTNATNATILDKAGIAAAYDAAQSNAPGTTTADDVTDAMITTHATKIDGVNVIFNGNIDATMKQFVEDYNKVGADGAATPKDYVASWDGKVLTLEAKVAGKVDAANTAANTAPAAAPVTANFGALTQNMEAETAIYELDLTGIDKQGVDPTKDADNTQALQAALAAKTVDGVGIDWVNEGKDATEKLNNTMNGFVDKYNADSTKDYTVEWADNKLTFTAKVAGAVDPANTAAGTAPAAAPTSTIAYTQATKDVKTFTITANASVAASDVLKINGSSFTVGTDISVDDAKDNDKLAAFIAKNLSSNDYDITVANNVITYTAKTAGANAPAVTLDIANTTNAANVPTAAAANPTTGTIATTTAAAPVEIQEGKDARVEAIAAGDVVVEEVPGANADGDGVVVIGTADYNFKTTAIKNVTAESGNRLASTYFDLTTDMVSDGGKFQIGKQEYTFSSEAADEGKDGVVYIGDLVDAEGNVDIAGNLDEIAQRVTDAAKANTTWTVGHEKGGSTLSFVEKQDQTEYQEKGKSSLTSVDNIAATFGWSTAAKTETTEETVKAAGTGKALTLQIGDTSDKFNQMSVNIGDMHTSAMGTGKTTIDGKETVVTKSIADIDIGSQEGAQEAVAVIKNAINYVSSVRGDLGAIQNRLEHTQNNLSVMAENIQDAESTIRDTDVAEEMMSYVKNNILVQSAQAMLAQANQLPQGVLQLLG